MGGYSTGPGSVSFVDAASIFVDDVDPTKKAAFQLSSITTATTRTITIQDVTGSMYVSGGTDVPVTDGGTGSSTAAGGATGLGVGTTDAVQHLRLGLGVAASATAALLAQTADNVDTAVFKINVAAASITAADTFVAFQDSTVEIADISGTAVSGVLIYNTFTGGHWSQSDSIEKQKVTEKRDKGKGPKPYTRYVSRLEPGTVLVSTDEMCEFSGNKDEVLPKCEVSTKSEDVSIYGVYGGHDEEGNVCVMSLGAGVICVCDEGGKIQVGDFLCSSSKHGEAKRYDGNDMRVVIAKARQSFTDKNGVIACTLLAG